MGLVGVAHNRVTPTFPFCADGRYLGVGTWASKFTPGPQAIQLMNRTTNAD